MAGGASSEMYMGVSMLVPPTPKPASTLPAYSSPNPLLPFAPSINPAPSVKTAAKMASPFFRPR